MERTPYLRFAEFGYENIEGSCGLCGAFVVINRATDLGNAAWANGMMTSCPKCKDQIQIKGETGNHPVDLFWMQESYVLFLQRRYMQSAIVLGQALELALSLCAANVFVHTPDKCDSAATASERETLREQFADKVLTLPLGGLRRLVSTVAVRDMHPASIQEALVGVAKVKHLTRGEDPSPADVACIVNEKIRESVYSLLSSSVVELRNAVAHQLYRPTQQEIEQMREEVNNLIRLTMTAFGVTPGGGQLIVGPPAGYQEPDAIIPHVRI